MVRLVSTVEEIEAAIARLPREDFFVLIERLRARHSDAWDRQIEDNAANGRLDSLWDEARREIAERRTVALNEVLDDKSVS